MNAKKWSQRNQTKKDAYYVATFIWQTGKGRTLAGIGLTPKQH